MNRLTEFDSLRGIAIAVIVVCHSSLSGVSLDLLYCLLTFALGSFFLVSGYLSYSKMSEPRKFIIGRLKRLYLPFLVFLVAFYAFNLARYGTDNQIAAPPRATIYHATLLTVFNFSDSAPGGLNNLSVFWFMPCLLVYSFLFVCCRSDKFRIILPFIPLSLNYLCWVLGYGFVFEWRFAMFFLAFSVGFFLSKHQSARWNVKILVGSILGFFIFLLIPLGVFASETYFYSLLWGMMFAVITPFLALRSLSYIHIKPLEGLGQLTLYMFMLDPFVTFLFESLTTSLLLDLVGRFALLVLFSYSLTHIYVVKKWILRLKLPLVPGSTNPRNPRV